MMITVTLSDTEWQAVLGVLGTAPWRDVNPVIVKIVEQVRMNQAAREQESRRQADYGGLSSNPPNIAMPRAPVPSPEEQGKVVKRIVS